MSGGGRSSWYPRDVTKHDRGLIVELVQEFGALGGYVCTLLDDMAGQQRPGATIAGDGNVKTAFLTLGIKARATPAEVRAVVERAAEIGQLTDLRIDEDGRRFRCRIADWTPDFVRGNETLKKANQRAAKADTSPAPGDTEGACPPAGGTPDAVSPASGDTSPDAGDVSPLLSEQDKTLEGGSRARAHEADPVELAPGVPPTGNDLVDQVIVALAGPLAAGRTVEFDPGAMGVAQIVISREKEPHDLQIQVANEAASRLADPAWNTRNAAKTLLYAWRDHDEGRARIEQKAADVRGAAAGPRRSGAQSPDKVAAAEQKRARSERRRARRDGAANGMAGSSLLTPTIDADAVEVPEAATC